MKTRSFPVTAGVALALFLLTAATVRAGILFGPFPFNLGPAFPGQYYSFNVAYGYSLPYTPAPDRYTFPQNWDFWRKPAPPGNGGAPATASAPAAAHPQVIPAAADREAGPATIEVRVPAGAEIWVDDDKTRQTGPVRVFRSPPLEKGKEYHYEVRARWTLAGKEVEQTQTVAVQGGGSARVAFPKR
jgi:uncharacterized protein (TIGR03000 family)